METASNRIYATGKRKNAVARIWIQPGSGEIIVNRRSAGQYFGRETLLMVVNRPLAITKLAGQYNIQAFVKGGGPAGQAGALQHAISKALLAVSQSLREPLKKEGLLTRDSRVKERKKYGQKGARKRFQFSKR